MLVSVFVLPDFLIFVSDETILQGETFEYVRFDKEYRYVSEQVSHHPPISACWAESPSWYYYGEVNISFCCPHHVTTMIFIFSSASPIG